MVEIPCGMTGVHGTVVLCDECMDKQVKAYPQGWRNHPGDTCIHGTYLDPSHDCCCYKCEDGVGREYELLCYCGASIHAPFDYEVDCDRCGQAHTMPANEEQLKQYNEDVQKHINEARFTGKIRIMRVDECGHESCVLTVDDDDALQYTLKGVEEAYPESRVFTEREERQRFMANQMLLDEDIY
jgi:hypothetical protein